MSKFNGPDYLAARDDERLSNQTKRVFDCMKDGQWRTLFEIAEIAEAPQASVSAQLRHLRKDRFGHHTVEKEHVANGLFKYRLILNRDAA